MARPTTDDLERTVIECVAYAAGVDVSKVLPGTDLIFDLGISGDDGGDLIAAVRKATGAQLGDYDFYQHFGPEAAFTSHKSLPLTVRQFTNLIEADLGIR